MSLIIEEEIVHFISNIESSRQSNEIRMDVDYLMQASIDQADVIKSCSEDHPISMQNMSKIHAPLVYKTMNCLSLIQ